MLFSERLTPHSYNAWETKQRCWKRPLQACLQALVKQADLGSVKRWLRCKSQQLPLPGECATKHREATSKGIKAMKSLVLAHTICAMRFAKNG